jgi:hypothetical protein
MCACGYMRVVFNAKRLVKVDDDDGHDDRMSCRREDRLPEHYRTQGRFGRRVHAAVAQQEEKEVKRIQHGPCAPQCAHRPGNACLAPASPQTWGQVEEGNKLWLSVLGHLAGKQREKGSECHR